MFFIVFLGTVIKSYFINYSNGMIVKLFFCPFLLSFCEELGLIKREERLFMRLDLPRDITLLIIPMSS